MNGEQCHLVGLREFSDAKFGSADSCRNCGGSGGGGDGQDLNFLFLFLVPQTFKSLKVLLNQPPGTFQPLFLVLNCTFCILASPVRNVLKTTRVAFSHKSLTARQG